MAWAPNGFIRSSYVHVVVKLSLLDAKASAQSFSFLRWACWMALLSRLGAYDSDDIIA